jgi:RNA polymerase sigma factor (sigma-70 family)
VPEEKLPFDETLQYFEEESRFDVIELHEAMERLEQFDKRSSEMVTLRFFGGFSNPEIAQHLGVSVSTVEKQLRLARAWLDRELRVSE